MDRPINYYGALARVLDILNTGQSAMVGLGKLAEAVLGTSSVVDGFTLVPTAPASLNATLSAGQVYQAANLEASPISSLLVDTHTIVKQGVMLDSVALTFVAPATVGFAQNFLVEVQYADSDTGNTLLYYYNAANPSIPLAGAGNNNQQQATMRKGVVAIQIKAGAAAASGTQVTPSPDAGWSGIYVVTLAYGQTTVTSGNIVKYSGAPFIPGKLSSIPAFVFTGQVQQTALSPIIYVRTDGNDSNDGSANTPSKALATIAAAVTKGVASYALTGTQLTIQLGNAGTYAPPGNIAVGPVSIKILGDIANQAGYILSGAGPAGGGAGLVGSVGTILTLSGLSLLNTSNINHNFAVSSGGSISCDRASSGISVLTSQAHAFAGAAGYINFGVGCTFTGYAAYMWLANGGRISNGAAITVSGTPTFSVATAFAGSGGGIELGFPISGAATGPRYLASLNGTINTFGAGANAFPGSTAGSYNTGGQYA